MAGKVVSRYLNKYGREILDSEVFKQAMRQTHHKHSSVGAHTLGVTAVSIWTCCLLKKLHVRTDVEDIVQGALCHDLGILGRDDKYENDHECYRRHPIDSVKVAEKLVPELSDKSKEIIRHHMWPVTKEFPTSREGVIVSVADKVVSVRDFFGIGNSYTA
jgi:uncharacterized protein